MIAYFPILKGKRGEYQAVAWLSADARARCTPIIELLAPPKPQVKKGEPQRPPKSIDQHVADEAGSVARCWANSDRPILVDFEDFPTVRTSKQLHPAADFLRQVRSRHVAVAPVVRPTSPLPLLKAIKDSAATDVGVCMRVSRSDLDAPDEQIDVVLSYLGLEHGDVDIILDAGRLEDAAGITIGAHVAGLAILAAGGWRSIALGGASFPESMSDFVGERRFERLEWTMWQDVARQTDAHIGFADFAVRPAAPPAQGPGTTPHPHVRYTTGPEWLILRDPDPDPGQYQSLYATLRDWYPAEWRGRGHCEGCRGIDNAAKDGLARSAEKSITFGTAHHITTVVELLANWVSP